MIEVRSSFYASKMYAKRVSFLDLFKLVLYCGYLGDIRKVPFFFKKVKCQTCMTDLTLSLEDLMQKMKSNTRNEIRRAQKEGCSFEIVENVGAFVSFYNSFCKSKGLADYTSLSRMQRYEKVLITQAVQGGQTLAMHANVLDDEGKIAFLLYSCSQRLTEGVDKKVIGWGNRLLHYMDLKYLKQQGFKQYDWSGVSTDPQSECYSIGQFKLSFGGTLSECWVLSTPLYRLGVRLRNFMMKLRK